MSFVLLQEAAVTKKTVINLVFVVITTENGLKLKS